MAGYWNNPAETARVLTKDGWLATGDIGLIDEDGHIVITDRKKDIIVNDKGDNVAPQRVEGMLTLQPEIGQAMVYGDRRPYLVGVVAPDPEHMMEWAAKHGVEVASLRQNPEFLRTLQAAVDRVNANLAIARRPGLDPGPPAARKPANRKTQRRAPPLHPGRGMMPLHPRS